MAKKLYKKGKCIGVCFSTIFSGVKISDLTKEIKRHIYEEERKNIRKIKNIRLKVEETYDGYGERVYNYEILGDRFETDGEQETRIRNEKHRQEQEEKNRLYNEQREKRI